MRRRSQQASVGLLSLALAFCLAPDTAKSADQAIQPFVVAGDAIMQPIGGLSGDAERGRKLVQDRETGNCLICHQAPITGEAFQGDLAPGLAGVGARLSPGQIRLRVVDQTRLNPATLMPPYYRVDGLTRVAEKFRNRPVFSAQEVEDAVAWLATLK